MFGNWSDDMLNDPKGVYLYRTDSAKEEYYEGEIIKNRKHGKGRYCYQNGNIYDGEFYNNMKDGKGELYFADTKDRYVGEFQKGARTG